MTDYTVECLICHLQKFSVFLTDLKSDLHKKSMRLFLRNLLFTALVVLNSQSFLANTVIKQWNGWYFTGRGCFLTQQSRIFYEMPENTTGLECALVLDFKQVPAPAKGIQVIFTKFFLKIVISF